MQLRICATVAWSCSPNTLSGLFWNWGACGFSAAIAFAASAASRAKCSLRAASRNVHQTGVDRWPGRSILPSGSRPALRAISRARSWYGSGRPIALQLAIAVEARAWPDHPIIIGISSEVKHELELGRSHYRQVARFLALQNSAHIIPSLTQSINQVGPIADKPAVFSCLPCC